MGLGGVLHWHNALGLEAQGASPLLVYVSMCLVVWSSNDLKGKRNIPLASMCTRADRVKPYKAKDE
jgi:hypothetical protein